MTQPRTVRVRVAVAVDSGGRWNARGWTRELGCPVTDDDADLFAEIAGHGVGEGRVIHWLWADLPIPSAVEVEAAVEETPHA